MNLINFKCKSLGIKKISRSDTICLCFILTFVLFCPPLWAQGILRAHFIDIGFGDAILVELPDEKTVVLDAGEARYGEKLAAYIRDQGIEEIDAAILTHPHHNHFGGFEVLMDEFPVKRFFYNGDERAPDKGYDKFLAKVKEKTGSLPRILKKGDVLLNEEGLHWEILSPGEFFGDTNIDSLVSILQYKKTAIVFTADADPRRLNPLIKECSQIAEADVLQIPHHGLEITQLDLRPLKNKYYIASVKENDVSREPLNFLHNLGPNYLSTAREGTIILESDGKNFRLVSE